jgi:acyl-CoA synthetase (NDP forming)
VGAASILAGGFAESGDTGLQDEILSVAREAGLRLLGPSSLGYADPRHGLVLTANAAFAEPGPRDGRLFAASHSGSMIGALASRGAAKGIGFAGLVSVGVEADLTLGEICMAALDDPGIDGFILFLESLRHASDMRRFALAASEAGKAVVVYKLGRSPQAAELAKTHTGALAGEDAVADAFFDACGMVRVQTLDALLEAPVLVNRTIRSPARRPRPKVGVLTTTGGGAAMIVDQLGVRDIEVTPPSDDTWARLAEAGVRAERGRIVDLTLAGTRYEVMKAALDVMTASPEFDLLVSVAGSSARFHPELAIQPAVDSAGAQMPIAVFATAEAPDALLMLARCGVPAFRTPESCADSIAGALRRRPPGALPAFPAAHASNIRFVDEATAYGMLSAAGVAVADHVAIEASRLPAQGPAFPVAVKALSADLPHKSDFGGVVLNVMDAEGVAAATRQILASVSAALPEIEVKHVLIQSMATGVGEVLIGFRRDPDVGPLVLLAPGGVLAEISAQRSLRLAPVTWEGAMEMIDELDALRALKGYRGAAPGDLAALAEAIVALSGFAHDPSVIEAEVNPLIVGRAGEGVVAVDALVRIGEEA